MSGEKYFDIVVGGHLCLDIIPTIKGEKVHTISDFMIPGKLIEVDKAVLSTGGSVSNTGITLKKLGLNVSFMAKVGEDHFGKVIIDILNNYGATDGIIKDKNYSSSYTVVIAIPGIDRIFLHNPGANNFFYTDDLNFEIIKKAKIFHFGYPPLMSSFFENRGEELKKLFAAVKELSVSTSLDMALPDPKSESGKADWDAILRKTLPYVDFFEPSLEEALYFVNKERFLELRRKGVDINRELDIDEIREIGETFVQYGAKIVIIKIGERGIYLKSSDEKEISSIGIFNNKLKEEWSNREILSPAFKAEKIASATGAGDSAIGGFLAAIVKGKTPEESLKIASAVGYENLQALDAISGIKSWDETLEIMKNLKVNKIPPEKSFLWDEGKELWYGLNDDKKR